MPTISKFWRIFDKIVEISAYISFGLLIFSWISVCSEVIFRYFLKQPLIWVVEVSEYIIVHITFLGSAWLLKREKHVVMDVVTSRLNKRARTLLLIITSIICTIIFLILTWWGILATLGAYKEKLFVPKQLDMPKFAVMIVIPFGSLMLAGEFIRRTHRAIITWRSLKKGNGV